jgi:hypothetical protein
VPTIQRERASLSLSGKKEQEGGAPSWSESTTGDVYYREFEKGAVVASPYASTTVTFSDEYIDDTTGNKANTFQIGSVDGKIYVEAE